MKQRAAQESRFAVIRVVVDGCDRLAVTGSMPPFLRELRASY
jgi:hypothetical protein